MPAEHPGFERMMNTTDAVKALGISRTTLVKILKRGAIPTYVLNKRILFRASDLSKYIESCRVSDSNGL